MNHLFVLRHGEQDSDTGNLNYYGIKQMRDVAREMKTILGNTCSNCLIMASNEARTQQSAKIISKLLDIKHYYLNDALIDDAIGSEAELKKMEAIDALFEHDKEKFEAVAIVTHYMVAGLYVNHFYEKHLKSTCTLKWPEKGHGYHIDLETMACTIIPKD